MSRYKGLFTFDVDNHRYIPVEQADGLISDMNYHPEPEEEPKEWWYIDIAGEVKQGEGNVPEHLIAGMKQIGNYFSLREEAELVVSKLKAWKRLRDLGTEILGWEVRDMLTGGNWQTVNVKLNIKARKEPMELLDTLFGGEEC